MMTRRVFLIVCAAILVASVLVVPTASAGPSQSGSAAAWRVLLYLDADNNLDVYAGAHHEGIVQVDLDELMAVGSVPGVDVFVLVDRWEGPATLFRVLPGSLEETAWPGNGKEANMGDPATLRSFVGFTFKASRATHTWLTFWDHGSPDYVAWDDNPGTAADHDVLTHTEVVEGLDGFHVDVIASDECLVGQIEVAYEYVAAGLETEYLVASEGYTGWRGYPYDLILEELAANPGMSSRDLASAIVMATDAYLSSAPYMGEVVNSHTAIDLGAIRAVTAALTGLTDLFVPDIKEYAGMITAARGGAQISWGNAAINVIDLWRFVEGVAALTTSAGIQAACADVLAALDEAIVGIQATQATERIAGGIGIYLPTQAWDVAWYEGYAFAGEGWLEFLEAYWAANGI